MQFRGHGANPEKLYEQFGIPMPKEVLDFSTNTSAVAQREGFAPDLRAALCDYPDESCAELCALISEQTGAPLENILVTSGANEAIYLIASFAANRKNLIPQPVYGEYAKALRAFGRTPESEFCFQCEGLPAGAVVWLCNPNNPTGSFIDEFELYDYAEAHPDCIFIIDEAYRDFVWKRALPQKWRPVRNVIRLRSFTKFYDLCGARIGCVLADVRFIEKLRERQPGWSVSSFAQQAALFFMRDTSLAERTRAFYTAEMPRFIAAAEGAGFRTRPTETNFFLMETDDDEALMRYLLERGMVVRHTRNFAGLDGRFVRIASRRPEQNDRLIEALRAYHC